MLSAIPPDDKQNKHFMHSCCPQVPSSPAKPGSLPGLDLRSTTSVWSTPYPCPLDLHWVCQCPPQSLTPAIFLSLHPILAIKPCRSQVHGVPLPLPSLPPTLATLDASGSSIAQRTPQDPGQYLVHFVYSFISQWMLALFQLLSILNDACCEHGCPLLGFLIIFPFICSFSSDWKRTQY